MTRAFFRRWLAALCCVAALLCPTGTLAAAGLTMEASMGYEGAITYVRRMPVTIHLQNDGADVEGRVVVDVNRNESEFDRYEMPVSVASGASVQVTVPVVLTQRQKQYTVQFLRGEEVLASQTITPGTVIRPASLIVGTLGRDDALGNSLTISQTSDPLLRGEYWTAVNLTGETFPADAESLRFFDVLAVDGVDLATLSREQQNALDAWLRGGGVVLVGGGAGAAEAFPFFQGYTGISAGPLENGGDVGQKLLTLFSMEGTGVRDDVLTVPLRGAKGVAVGAEQLADVTCVENGAIITASFALGEKPLSAWMSKNAMWQRLFLRYIQSMYEAMVRKRSSGSYQMESIYVDSGVTGSIGIPNGEGMELPLYVLGVFVLLVGFGGYFLLKKLGKREWMWLGVPVLCVGASLVLWSLGSALSMREPAAVHYTIQRVDSDGTVNGFTGVSVAQASREPMAIGITQGVIDLPSTLSYYAPDGMQEEPAATKLRVAYTYGAQETMTVTSATAWQQHNFAVTGAATQDVSGVSGSCSWERDGLHFQLLNASGLALSKGLILTDYGFVSVPELLPGQTMEVVLRSRDSKADSGTGNDVRDGVMISEQARSNVSVYNCLSIFIGDRIRETESDEEKSEWRLRENMWHTLENMSRDESESRFQYITFSDALDHLQVMVDGQIVQRAAQMGCVMVKLSYQPIASDGSVRFLRGSFPVSLAVVNDQGAPSVGDALNPDKYQSFSLSDAPAFAFDLSAMPEGMTVTAFDIASRYMYYSYKVSLYNTRTGRWDEFKSYASSTATTKSTLPDLEPYVANDVLFARFEQYGGMEEYADVSYPSLTLEGRLD